MNDGSTISSTEEKKAGIFRWFTVTIYQIFYKKLQEENRAELFQILGREIALAPLYKKTLTPILQKSIDIEQEKNLFKSRIQALIHNNLIGRYNKDSELMSLADSFNTLSSNFFERFLII